MPATVSRPLRKRFSSAPKAAKSSSKAKYSDKFFVHFRPVELRRPSSVATNRVMQVGRRNCGSDDDEEEEEEEWEPSASFVDDDDSSGGGVDNAGC